ncbi:TonB-dependent receptor [Methyloradius palustris]|uniref:Iron transport receptor protein n=1 Tax=Methyloradius palustris TaxID=2778876 RepID=A0A8D5GF53_9PROT|nr:TonB-dependent siderophore receptor [Methyloradius palustris]BCM25584.1 iron transport receptor protein [Methyloradius palustris]
MKKSQQKYNGKLNPVATAVALVFTGTGSAYAAPEEATTLPEVKVSAPEVKNAPETEYKTEKASSSKFTAPLIDTPKSITVIPQSVIQDSGSVTLEDALRTVPGITFGSAEGGGSIGDRPFIRGFDSQASMYVDGIRDVGGQSREIFAIESVEVLKGPSGAFDGRGSAGGSINLVSKLPKAENFVSGSVGLGTDKYRRATGDVNYMLSDDVAVRVNVMAHSADTPGRDEVDVSRWGFAPSITLGMNSPTSATLSYYHLQTDDMPDYGIPYTFVGRSKATPSQPANVDMDNFYGLTNRDFRKTQSDIGTATIKHAFSETTVLKNTTRYGVSTNDYIVTVADDSAGNVANGNVYRSAKSRNSKTDTLANVTDLSIKFDAWKVKHSANIGLELSHEETKNDPYQIIQNGLGFSATGGNLRTCSAGGGVGAALQSNYDCTSLYTPNPNDPWSGTIEASRVHTTSTATTRSAYAFDSMELSKKWILNLGIRYDSYSTESDVPSYQRRVPTGNGLGANAIGATVPELYLQNDSAFFNYQAGVVYKLKPNASVYASFGTSSTPSGTTLGTGSDNLSGGVATNANLDPERSKNYEIGTKWDVLEGLALTAATFYTEKTNARATLADGTTALVGNQELKGLELGFAGRITDKWQAFGGYTYLDGKLVDNGSGVFNNAPSAGLTNNVPNSVNNGNQFPNTPKNSVSLWNTYAVMPNLTVGGGAYYVDKQFGNAANSVVIPSYVRIDAMANYKIDKNLSLQLNVQNLTDERYFNAAYTSHYAQVAAGRLAFLTLNFKY